MTSTILSFLLIFTITLAQPAAGGVKKEAALGEEFEIRLGQQVLIRQEGLKLSFTYVAEDSRCPEGVNCIWAGNGKIVLRLSKTGRRANVMRLNTTLEPKQDDYRGYDVKLVRLDPYPKKDTTIKRKAYVATLMVTRK